MNTGIFWDKVFQKLTEGFEWLIRSVELANIRVQTRIGRTSTVWFPFGAYVSFNVTKEPGHEDIVLSVDCNNSGAGLTLSCDISRGDGVILSEGPRRSVPAEQEAGQAVLEWSDEVLDYIRASALLVTSELRSRS